MQQYPLLLHPVLCSREQKKKKKVQFPIFWSWQYLPLRLGSTQVLQAAALFSGIKQKWYFLTSCRHTLLILSSNGD